MGESNPSGGKRKSWGRRALVVLVVTCAVALGFEVLLRFVVTYNIDYYALRTDPGTHDLPYGRVLINSLGFPDEEWDLTDPRPRVGYIGDSVVFGTGAGYGSRLSDVLDEARPRAQHLTLAGAQSGIQSPKKLLELVDRFSLTKVVYAMNLNDVLPTPRMEGGGRQRTRVQGFFSLLRKADALRGEFYLYNYTRARLRNVMRRHGYVASGRKDVEFFPRQSERLIRETAERINRAAGVLREHGVELCVLLLPYEMQISEEAARRYWELGIRWEDEFLERGTQRRLIDFLDQDLDVVDTYFAFVDPHSPVRDRASNGLGEFFVYNRGDKIDYNHPTPDGHRKIAEYALSQGFCAPGNLAVARADPKRVTAPDIRGPR